MKSLVPDLRILRVLPPALDLPLPAAPGVFDHPVTAASLARFTAQRDRLLLVAIVGGASGGEQIIGQLTAHRMPHPEERPDDLYVDELGVSPTWRRRGVATALLDALGSHLGGQEPRQIWLAAEADNHAAQALYRQVAEAPEPALIYQLHRRSPRGPASWAPAQGGPLRQLPTSPTLDLNPTSPPPPRPTSLPLGRTPTLPGMDGLERYLDLGPLGEGGTAQVRRVRDQELHRTVAMKIIHPERSDHSLALARFIEEIQITAQLQHPGIVPLYDAGRLPDGRVWFTMKEVRGNTLGETIRRAYAAPAPASAQPVSQPVSQPGSVGGLRWLVGLLHRVSLAVAYAHERGVLHRDLKPANIMIGDLGEVWVMDWGLSKPPPGGEPVEDAIAVERSREGTLLGRVVGTPAYMAPEQAAGQNDSLDTRADIYALGAILYEILAGRSPYPGTNAREVLRQVRAGPPAPPQAPPGQPVELPRALLETCERAMARAPEDRFASVRQLAGALEAWLQGWQLHTRTIPAGTVFAREGEAGSTAWILQAGRCRVYRTVEGQELELGELGPGEVCGETAAMTGSTRIASVQALTELRVTEVDRSALAEALRLDSPLGAFVLALAHRYREAALGSR